MLIPLTRSTYETLVPAVATGAQYAYCSGKFADFLQRLLISGVGAVLILVIIRPLLPFGSDLLLIASIMIGLYCLWGPILWASLRNLEHRKFPYSGFWRGEVLDLYMSDELVGEEETVNERGDLVIVENRERRLILEVGDETGFSTQLRVPVKRQHQAIRRGDIAEMLVMSSREDLSRISKTSDIYLPDRQVWVSDYPYVQREAFVEVSQRLRDRELRPPKRDSASRNDLRDNVRPERLRGTDNQEPSRARRRSTRRRPSTDWD
jgi:hypothetical protein